MSRYINRHGLSIQDAMRAKLRQYSTSMFDDCWIWTHAVNNRNGYPVTCYNGRYCFAHEISFRLFVGPIPPSMKVVQTCDHDLCINPAHLVLDDKRVPRPEDSIPDFLMEFAVEAFVRRRVKRGTLHDDITSKPILFQAFLDFVASEPEFKRCSSITKNRFGRLFNTAANPNFVRRAGVTYVCVYLIDKEALHELP
jgi:hypothetical protein